MAQRAGSEPTAISSVNSSRARCGLVWKVMAHSGTPSRCSATLPSALSAWTCRSCPLGRHPAPPLVQCPLPANGNPGMAGRTRHCPPQSIEGSGRPCAQPTCAAHWTAVPRRRCRRSPFGCDAGTGARSGPGRPEGRDGTVATAACRRLHQSPTIHLITSRCNDSHDQPCRSGRRKIQCCSGSTPQFERGFAHSPYHNAVQIDTSHCGWNRIRWTRELGGIDNLDCLGRNNHRTILGKTSITNPTPRRFR